MIINRQSELTGNRKIRCKGSDLFYTVNSYLNKNTTQTQDFL